MSHRTTIQNVQHALQSEIFLIRTKPYFFFQEKNEVAYLKKSGFTQGAAYDLVRLIYNLKLFHIDVIFSLNQKDWKREITLKDLVRYFDSSKNDTRTSTYRVENALQILKDLEMYITNNPGNEIPITDTPHAHFMHRLASWYLRQSNLPNLDVPTTGNIVDVFNIIGKPAAILVVNKSIETPQNNVKCGKHRAKFKEYELKAEKMIQTFLKDPKASLVSTPVELYPREPGKKDEVTNYLKEAVENRYGFIKEKCYMIRPGSDDEKYRARAMLTNDMHDLAMMLCKVLTN